MSGSPARARSLGYRSEEPLYPDEKDQHLLQELCRRSPELVSVRQLAQLCLRLVRERPGGRDLDDWVAAVHNTGPAEPRGPAEISSATGLPSLPG